MTNIACLSRAVFAVCGPGATLIGDDQVELPDGSIVAVASLDLDAAIAAIERPQQIAGIKAECRRRILLVMSEDQQRNTLAAGQAATMQYGADPAGWPEALQARQSAALVAWAEIERLRAKSNAIEAMDPLPADVAVDELWEGVAVD
ncbi:MAG: hypothetical protein KIT02_10255 [Devosia sp.]|uniref:hypothetical protein n=1 Tax=Devosia sp. TaxID=1871048 RepID=UPI0024C87610|nr:hypothetical protein [Devosia sp.]UYN98348.1 MAG: hypothetical protein KIT02_10255 [Devosia sp.]